MDSLSNLIAIVQINQNHKNSQAIIPYSKLNIRFLNALRVEKLIDGYSIKYSIKEPAYAAKVKPQSNVYLWKKHEIVLRLNSLSEGVGFKRISKPGRRVYCKIDFLKKNQNPFELLMLSTTHGIISAKDAIFRGVGGELLCKIWL